MKAECSKQTDPQKIKYLCDVLLNPATKQIDDFETLDWCRWLISGGSTFEEFAKTGDYLMICIHGSSWKPPVCHVESSSEKKWLQPI